MGFNGAENFFWPHQKFSIFGEKKIFFSNFFRFFFDFFRFFRFFFLLLFLTQDTAKTRFWGHLPSKFYFSVWHSSNLSFHWSKSPNNYTVLSLQIFIFWRFLGWFRPPKWKKNDFYKIGQNDVKWLSSVIFHTLTFLRSKETWNSVLVS